MISELRAEREQIEEAIMSLERLARGQGKRRGRPPKWMTTERSQATDGVDKPKRTFSAETRRKMALAQKARWAARRKFDRGYCSSTEIRLRKLWPCNESHRIVGGASG